MSGARYLALYLPLLPLDRLRRRDPALAGQALASWAQQGSRRLLACTDAPHLHPGQALADAQAICPDLQLFPAEPEADAALLHHLALWALRFTPLAAADPPDGLLLEATGVTELFGGESGFTETVLAAFRAQGFRLRGAMAGNPALAAALARGAPDAWHRAPPILRPEQEAAAIAALPLTALRLPEDLLLALTRLGLRSLGAVLRQPRAPLARRFGRVLLDALDAVTGARTPPIQPVRPPPRFAATLDCLEPIVTRPAIERALDHLLAQLCRTLLAEGEGARRLLLRAFRVDGAVQELAIGTGAPSREPAHLRRLFAEALGRLEPDLGFEKLDLEALATDPLPGQQTGLPGSSRDPALLAELLDRLGQRMALRRMAPLDSHWPEYAAAPGEPLPLPPGWAEAERPVRLLAEPIPLAVTAEVPDGPPLQLRHGQVLHRVLHSIGPERLEPEWWGGDADRPARDYFRVQTAEGPRLWICRLIEGRQPPRWYLHGYLA